MRYDLIVIGGGPAGYVAAIRAAQLGKTVLCVERERVGGTCLNWGCIPTKALLKNAEVFSDVSRRAAEFGVKVEGVSLDWSAVIARSRRVSERLSNGISFLLKKNKVDFITAEARIVASGVLELKLPDGSMQTQEAANILIATGARTREVPAFPFDGLRIIGSRDALQLGRLPESMLVIGSGAIGTELSYIYHSFGCKVTLVEALPRLMPNMDEELSRDLERSFQKQGIRCLCHAKVESLRTKGDSVTATVQLGEKAEELTADVCLVAIGVVPVVPEANGLKLTERGFIEVNERYETSIKGVYAAGDCIGGVMLAHTASYEALQAVQGIFDASYAPRHSSVIPACCYCQPELASVGKTESELKEAGVDYKCGKFPFQAIGKALAAGESEGYVKLLFGKENGELLGAHIIGPHATELISTPELAMNSELTDADIEAMIYAHPTLSEAIHEAVLAADGKAIHI